METEKKSGCDEAHRCARCGEPIDCEVARVDSGRLYHLRCFRRHVHGGDEGLRECPRCETLGERWSGGAGTGIPCGLCGGSGYLSGDGPVTAGLDEES